MKEKIILSVLNAKYIHASPAPYYLLCGIKEHYPKIADNTIIIENTINENPQEIIDKIMHENPTIISFSCYIWNIEATLSLCTQIKNENPNITIVLGGPEVSYCADLVLNQNPQIDYILSGDGEQSVPELFNAILNDPETIHNTQGLCYRKTDNTIHVSEPHIVADRVYSPLAVGYAQAVNGRIAYFESSRGCPYSCAFCLSGRCGNPRFFPLDDVFSDLITLANSGTQTVKFIDRTFNAYEKHANAILQFILDNYGTKLPKGVCFHFEIAGDILKESTFKLLETMPIGAVQLEIGMQSFHEPTLSAVNRKTNTKILCENINRLIAMKNMHIHIDLIAGLPYETLEIFKTSFNIGYNLKAQMLQLGFLKMLHGSPLRDNIKEFPCSFSEKPPYEIQSTKWLSADDLSVLSYTEDALDRIYNSGRFLKTAEYVIETSGVSPFDFYQQVGKCAQNLGLSHNVSLDAYTAFLYEFLQNFDNVNSDILRDMLIRDRLSTNKTGKLPKCLHKQDKMLAKLKYALTLDKKTAPHSGIVRGIAILYGSNTLCYVDYTDANYDLSTHRWRLTETAISHD